MGTGDAWAVTSLIWLLPTRCPNIPFCFFREMLLGVLMGPMQLFYFSTSIIALLLLNCMGSWQRCFCRTQCETQFFCLLPTIIRWVLEHFYNNCLCFKTRQAGVFSLCYYWFSVRFTELRKNSLILPDVWIVCAKTKCSLFFLCSVSFLWVSARNDGKVSIVSHDGGYYIARTFSWSVPLRFPSWQSAQLVGSQGPKGKDKKNIVLCLKLYRKKCLCTTRLRTAESSRATRTCCRNGRGLGASATRQLNFVITAVFIVHESCKKTDGKDSKSWSKRLHSVMHALIAFQGI